MSASSVSIAALLACYDRREKTLRCLERLFSAADEVPHAKVRTFLLDDASPDGTGQAVSETYPDVVVLQGTGNLFWNRGMHRAMTTAMREGFDFYLWLNDDTLIEKSTLKSMIDTAEWVRSRGGSDGIIVGSTEARSGSGITTYGGRKRVSVFRPLRSDLVAPASKPISCDTMNGNCVLIPSSVVKAIGPLDPVFHHSMGDMDYGFRARKAGFGIWVMPGFAGVCGKNLREGAWMDPEVPLLERLRNLTASKGLPLWPWAVYAFRHGGLLGLVVWAWTYVNLFRTSILHWARREGR